MADTAQKTVEVMLRARADKTLVQPFDQLGKAATDANKKIEDMAKKNERSLKESTQHMVGDMTKLDRGLRNIQHGFMGLTMNLSMLNTSILASGGHLGKFAEHAQHAIGVFASIHSSIILVKGLASTTLVAGGALVNYTRSATAATIANEALAQSHLAVAQAATAQSIAEGTATGGASRLGTVGRLAGGAGVGAMVGLGAGTAAGHPWLGMAAGAAVGMGGVAAAAKWGPAVWTSIKAAAVSGAGMAAAAILATGTAAFVATTMIKFFIDEIQHKGRGAASTYWRERQRSAAIEKAIEQRPRRLGMLTEHEKFFEQEHELGARQMPLHDMERQARQELRIDRLGTTRFFADRNLSDARAEFSRLQQRSVRPGAGGLELGGVQAAAQIMAQVAMRGPKGTAESAAALERARGEHGAAAMRAGFADLALRRTEANLQGDPTNARRLAERDAMQKRFAEAVQQELEAKHQLIAAERAHGQAERDRLENWRNWAKDAKQFYKDEAQHKKDAMKEGISALAMQDALTQKQVLAASRSFKGGEKLSKEQWDLLMTHGGAEAQGILRERVLQGPEGEARKRLGEEVFKNLGVPEKIKQAEEQAKAMENVAVKIDNQIKAEIKINEQSLADEVTEKLVPLIQQAILNVPKIVEVELQRAQRQAQVGKPQ